MPGPMSTLVMERKSELQSIKMYHLTYTHTDNLGIQTEKCSHAVNEVTIQQKELYKLKQQASLTHI